MRAAFFTLGCKVNQYETAALKTQFSEAGYEIVEPDERADVYVVNSCTVTAEGDKKSRQALRRMKRKNPGAITCLCGCFPQAFPDAAQKIEEADVVLGAKDKGKLLAAVTEKLETGGRVVNIAPHEAKEHFESMSAGKFYSRTRAFLKIEDGCRRYCAYCIIPTARGPVRSKSLDETADELKSLAEAGYSEVVLAGINLSCYGQDLGLRLIDAVRLACSIDGIERVRLSSLEPELLTRDDIKEMAKLAKLCPHFHLSLQSGCDETLKQMRRQYTTAEYLRIVGDLREAFDNAAITTDIMVGFPGETDAVFAQSLKFCTEIGFAKAHVFAYSQRSGTLAASMNDQIPAAVKRERSKLMIEATENVRTSFLESQLGRPAEVLFETRRGDGLWEGYSKNYTPILMSCEKELCGKILTVTPDSLFDGCLLSQDGFAK